MSKCPLISYGFVLIFFFLTHSFLLGPWRSCQRSHFFPMFSNSPENVSCFATRLAISSTLKSVTPKRRPYRLGRPCRVSTFFLVLGFASTFDSHIFSLWSQISVQLYFGVFVYEKAVLRDASLVCDRWRVTDIARESPFSPKYAQIKVF